MENYQGSYSGRSGGTPGSRREDNYSEQEMVAHHKQVLDQANRLKKHMSGNISVSASKVSHPPLCRKPRARSRSSPILSLHRSTGLLQSPASSHLTSSR